MSRKAKKRPPKCCKPDCFHCPYVDCRYDVLETDDYTESNKRDHDFYEESTGKKLHKGTDLEYQNKRHNAYRRENKQNTRKKDRSAYFKLYYQEHREEKLEEMRKNYDAKKHHKWRNKNIEKKREYDHQRYLRRKEAGEFAKGRKESV